MGRMMIDGEYVADGLVVRINNTGAVGVMWCVGDERGMVLIPGSSPVEVGLGEFEFVDPANLVGVKTRKVMDGSTVRIKHTRSHKDGIVGICWMRGDGEVSVIAPGAWMMSVMEYQVELVDPSELVWMPKVNAGFTGRDWMKWVKKAA